MTSPSWKRLPWPTLASPAHTRQAPVKALKRSGHETRSRLDAPVTVLPGHDIDRLVTAELRSVLAPAAELDGEMHLARSDMDRRALRPPAPRPAGAGAGMQHRDLALP